ncbi:hypothetical protein OAF27_01855 [Verrucomicrobiales bacterium]|nr:hypothetical protein [Verrucomicrobiales bacterium]
MKRTSFIILVTALALCPALPARGEKPMTQRQLERMQKRNQREAQEAWGRDKKNFSRDDFASLEKDYQEINAKYREPEIMDIIERFLKKYKEGNRVGCAMLYLAQKSRGKDKEALLEKVIENFSDSYYLNGCSVGGLAHLQLAGYYQSTGDKNKAKKLADEIRENYKTAQDQGGKPVIEQLEGIGE